MSAVQAEELVAVPWIVRTLGWRATRRPRPLLGTSLAGVGGALAALGLVVIGAAQATGPGGSGVPGAILCVVLLTGGLALLRYAPNPLRSAGTSAVAISIPMFWAFVLLVKSNPGDGDTVTLLSAICLGLLYLFGPARGRAVLLAVALVLGWSFVAGKTGSSGTIGTLQTESRSFSSSGSSYYEPTTPSYLGSALVSLLFGAAFFAALLRLDRNKLSGIATAFVVPAIGATAAGVILLGQEFGVVAGTMIGLGAGVGVAFVGARGQRRATAWFGAFGALVSVVGLVGYITKDASGPEAFGAAAIAGGIALGAAAMLLHLASAEPDEDAAPLPPAGPSTPPPPAATAELFPSA